MNFTPDQLKIMDSIIARYPRSRSAVMPLLHYVQALDGYVTPRGIEKIAELLDISTAEVTAVSSFYTQYRTEPAGEYHVGVCINTLCAVMGGDAIYESLENHLGIKNHETTADGKVSIERIECNAACDYAPVVMVNWEFYDNQTPQSVKDLVDSARSGNPTAPTRGPKTLRTWKQNSEVLAGLNDGLSNEGVAAGEATLLGLRIAKGGK
ncbi:NADH dehydrogenase subunit E [freshwater metagenome]|jgi:NADH-quinone oxidoreductase subunit E|uniref:NADH dehydrogenase subunit E n=1 Tax=freshwater metagenome TaxID=449393 RepID=A0A094R3Q3_9ZZZZ|nr:NADH-quinone oxidoreductase subunit NuoE [Actinomycetota bacterium]MDA2981515.1 NADH-quinone oxidoreductase subunit NuoE [Actinomycetota bacterium]MDA2995942.1 NADH-quinone oxidoreductase subunit NuoE [Actinomycetota bacterium]